MKFLSLTNKIFWWIGYFLIPWKSLISQFGQSTTTGELHTETADYSSKIYTGKICNCFLMTLKSNLANTYFEFIYIFLKTFPVLTLVTAVCSKLQLLKNKKAGFFPFTRPVVLIYVTIFEESIHSDIDSQ